MKTCLYLLVSILCLFSCKNNEVKKIVQNEPIEPRFEIEISTDTILKNEYLKAIVELKTPFFENDSSKIFVILENDENFPLKEDLSNEYDIPIEGFENLGRDTINQKWFREYDFNKASTFGRKFSTSGNKKIRGYILEYISKEPPLDSVANKELYRKYYFERDVYVLEDNE